MKDFVVMLTKVVRAEDEDDALDEFCRVVYKELDKRESAPDDLYKLRKFVYSHKVDGDFEAYAKGEFYKPHYLKRKE
jgi:hypothetical protein